MSICTWAHFFHLFNFNSKKYTYFHSIDIYALCLRIFLFDVVKFPLHYKINPWHISFSNGHKKDWRSFRLKLFSFSCVWFAIQCNRLYEDGLFCYFHFCCNSQFNFPTSFLLFRFPLPLYVQINKRTHQKVFWFVFTHMRERKRKEQKPTAKVEHDTVS